MAVEALKSTSITNDDATPIVLNSPGAGAPGAVVEVDDYATVSASASVASTYRICRVPTNAKVKYLVFESEAQGAGKFNIGVYLPNGGAIGFTGSDSFFVSDVDCASAVTPINDVNESGTYTLDKRKQPLWQAIGAAADPGGFYDIVATVHTTAITTGTGKIGLRVGYTI